MKVLWHDDQLLVDIDSVIKVVKSFAEGENHGMFLTEDFTCGMMSVANALESVKFEYVMRERLKETDNEA